MQFLRQITRRNFLISAGAAGIGLSISGCSRSEKQEESGTVLEILDRQHGVLRRAIAILEEIKGGMDARMDLPPEILQGSIEVLRWNVDYHQKLEEKFIYPAFQTANKMGGLVGVLREQHAAGTQLMNFLKQLSAGFSAKDLERRRTLGSAVHEFSRMYRAHSDREDTVLFPALRSVIPSAEYGKLSQAFLDEDNRAMGRNGFAEAVQKLASFEEVLGIGDLAAFTPRTEELR